MSVSKMQLCDAKPESPVMFNHVEKDGSWYCLLHRYPPCSVCRITPRPESAMHSKMKFKDWTCEACRHTQKAEQTTPQPFITVNDSVECSFGPRPSNTTAMMKRGWHPCTECHLERQTKDFRQRENYNIPKTGRCRDCEFPPCAACGKQRLESEGPVPQQRPENEADGSGKFPGQRAR